MSIKKILLSSVVFALLFFVISSSVKMHAEVLTTTENLSVIGAQIRVAGEHQGIRFVADAKDYDKALVKSYGIAVAFGNNEVSNDFKVGGSINGRAVLNVEVTQLDENDRYYAVLYDIPEGSYVQNVTARAYVILNDDSYVYSSNVIVRNLAEVSVKAFNDGVSGELLIDVLAYVGDNYKKEYTDLEGNVILDNAIKEFNLEKIREIFIADYNRVMGTTMTSMVGFATANMGRYAADSTETEVKENPLYKFFTLNDRAMFNKWGWLV